MVGATPRTPRATGHQGLALFTSPLKAAPWRTCVHAGDLVMTMHWSQINYSAIVKILKKHDKRTGVLLRAPYLANVLHQVRSSGGRAICMSVHTCRCLPSSVYASKLAISRD